jgi:hypothetical protein
VSPPSGVPEGPRPGAVPRTRQVMPGSGAGPPPCLRSGPARCAATWTGTQLRTVTAAGARETRVAV